MMFGIDFGGLLTSALSGLGNAIISLAMWVWNEAVMLIMWLISLLPSLPIWPGPSINQSISIFLGDTTQQFNAWNYYVPLNLWIVLSFTMMAFTGLSAVFKVIRWALTHIPFVGGAE